MVLSTLIQDYMPMGIIGLLLAAILSATMSTSSTCLICSVTCLTEDVIKPLMKNKMSDKQSLQLFRGCMIGIGVGTIAITLFATDIIGLLTTAYAAAVAGLFVPMMGTMFIRQSTKPAIYVTMIVGLVLYGAIAFVPGAFSFLPEVIVAAPLYLSLPIAIVLYIVIAAVTQKSATHGRMDAYFKDLWEDSPGNWEKHPEIINEDGSITVPADAYAKPQ
jgi:SSS family solute:Na+ symporter